jgi:hypothetical protein
MPITYHVFPTHFLRWDYLLSLSAAGSMNHVIIALKFLRVNMHKARSQNQKKSDQRNPLVSVPRGSTTARGEVRTIGSDHLNMTRTTLFLLQPRCSDRH